MARRGAVVVAADAAKTQRSAAMMAREDIILVEGRGQGE